MKCDQIEQFMKQGYNVVYDPPGDGNSIFCIVFCINKYWFTLISRNIKKRSCSIS